MSRIKRAVLRQGHSLSLAAVLTCIVCANNVQPTMAQSADNRGMTMDGAAMMENDQLKTADGKSYQITRTVINASPEDVFAVIVDYKDAGRLFSNLTKSEVVSRDEKNKTSNVSFSLKGIMNLWSFDYVLSIKENFPTRIDFKRVSGAFKRNEGYWKLLPLDNGRRTEVVYAKFIDAGLMVPPQVVAKQVRESTESVMLNLKQVAETNKIASHHS
ncbi:MAG: SRPBCC family protein [Cyanobacteria bacterium SZAS TMP-1]|nr:SRPBCC family protein [Cyanobacteria bacterium SZAS TMP-1]